MAWFGESWGSPFNQDCPQIPVPTGETCDWCVQPIADSDSGVRQMGIILDANRQMAARPMYWHRNCWLRQTVGSVGHQMRRCGCYVGMDNPGRMDDPPGLSDREAADAAVQLFYDAAGQPAPH
jgi:hypothetical protein